MYLTSTQCYGVVWFLKSMIPITSEERSGRTVTHIKWSGFKESLIKDAIVQWDGDYLSLVGYTVGLNYLLTFISLFWSLAFRSIYFKIEIFVFYIIIVYENLMVWFLRKLDKWSGYSICCFFRKFHSNYLSWSLVLGSSLSCFKRKSYTSIWFSFLCYVLDSQK